MKKIGFVDYYISEWHANNYPEWIRQANEKLGADFEVSYCFAELDVSPLDGVSTDEWCEKFGVKKCDTIEELCEKSDAVVIFAPSNPETHLRLAQKVLPFGKPTYIDKTFAPNLEIAKEIFDIAKTYNAPFFSTSALRFANEFEDIGKVNNIIITAGGDDFEEYIIHPVEIYVSLFKEKAERVKVETIGKKRLCRISAEKGKEIAIIFAPTFGYSLHAEKENGENIRVDVSRAFFPGLIENILRFFESKKEPFNPDETLEVMRLRDGLLKAEKQDGKWIEI